MILPKRIRSPCITTCSIWEACRRSTLAAISLISPEHLVPPHQWAIPQVSSPRLPVHQTRKPPRPRGKRKPVFPHAFSNLSDKQYCRSRQSSEESRSSSQIRSAAFGANAQDGTGQGRGAAPGRSGKVRAASAEGTAQIQIWQVWSQNYRRNLVPGRFQQFYHVLGIVGSVSPRSADGVYNNTVMRCSAKQDESKVNRGPKEKT